MIERFRRRRGQEGFTLIELLVVIIILGVLSAVVVFAVRGTGDKGQSAAKLTDEKTVRTAEEAYCAQNGRYGTMQELVDAKFLSEKSSITDASPVPGGACTGSGDLSKAGFVTGFAQPNGGSPTASTGYPELKLAVNGAGAGIYPTPFETGGRGPAMLQMAYIFDSLVWKDATGLPMPWMVTKLPNETDGSLSNGGKTWKFTLRPGIKFTDDVPVKASDVKFTFDYQRPARPGFPGGAASTVTKCFCLSQIQFVDTVDANDATGEITFNLNQPINTFINSFLYSMVILPKHIWENVTTTSTPSITTMHTDPAGKAYIGSGPYKFFGGDPALQVAYNPDTASSAGGASFYTANPSYVLGTPYVRKLNFVKPPSDSVLALTSKAVDAGGLGTEEIVSDAAISQVSSYPRVSTPGGFNRVMQFNLRQGAPYNNVKFRQAVAHAVDRQAILSQILGGRGVTPSFGTLNPTHPMVATGLPGYDLGTRPANVAKAKALLAEAGFTDNVPAGGDGKLELPGTSANWAPFLDRGVVSATSPSTGIPDMVRLNLEEVGLFFTLRSDTNQFAADTRATSGNYGMMLVNWGNNTADPDQLRTRLSDPVTAASPCFSCIFGWNAANGSPGAAEFQSLAAQQLIEPNPTLRKQQVQRMQVLAAADAIQFALYIPDQLLFYQPGSFSAWYPTPGGTPPGPPSYSNKHVFVTGKQFGLPAGF